MKKTLLLIAALYGFIACAADAPTTPVAVWNGDLSIGSVKDDKYTMSSESSVVTFADGIASLTKSTSVQSKGVEISWDDPANDSTLPQNQITVFVKYSGYNADNGNNSLVSVLWGNATTELVVYGTGGKNRIRAAHSVGTSGSGTQDNADANGIQQTIPAEGILMVSLAGINGELSGTRVAIAAKSGDSYGDFTQYYYNSGYKFSSSLFYGVRIGGTQTGTGNYYRPQLTVEGVAIYATGTTVETANTIKASIFPAMAERVVPLMLLNINNGTAVAGWLNHTQDGGGAIPNSGSLTTNGISFVTSSDGNFYKQCASGTSFKPGEFVGLDGKTYDSIASEVAASLNLSTGIVFDDSVYNTGVMNGGKNNHTATLSGLDNSAKYLLYIGCGRDHVDGNYQSGFKFETAGCASVEELAYVNTDSTSYQTGSLNNDMLSTTDGLLIVRAKGIKPANGTIQFKMVGGRSSLNFLAVAKVNETISYTTAEIEGGSETSVTAFNALLADTNNKAEVTLSDGAVVSYDAALKVPTKFISSGSITLSANAKPDLTNLDLSGVTGGVLRTWMTDAEKAGIGFNFNNNQGGNTTVALATTAWKSDANSNNGSNIAMTEDGITKITWTSNNLYTDQQNSGTILHGYLDDSAGVNITVSNIPFAEYAVIIYSTTDTENAKLSYKTVNGKDYTADGTKDVAKEGTEAWGRSRSSAEAAYGTNALRIVAQTSGSLVIHSANRSGARGCISAIQIVPYTTKVKPSIETDFELVAVEATAEDYTSGTVTLDISGVKENDYSITYTAVVNGLETPITGAVDKEQGLVSFNLDSLVPGTVYRGTITLTYDDGKVLATTPIAVHAGEQKYIWTTEGELWVNETATTIGTTGVWTDGIAVSGEKLVVNTASGVTFTPKANPDYVEKCDSTFTVSISASEAVDAASDPAPTADVQGGVRIASVRGDLKVQALADGVWADLKSSGVDTDKGYEVVVAFHYAKDGVKDDADSVSYTLDGVTVTGGKVANTVAKISSVEVADGTSLAFLKGICELDKAVVVDVEVGIGHGETAEITAADEKAAQEIADKMVIAIASEIAEKLTAAQQEAYRGYFKVQVTQAGEGKFSAAVVFKADVEKAIEDELEKSMEKVVGAFNTIEGKAEIAAKPGLYYGVKRGETLDSMNTVETTLATGDTVTITITKPEGAAAHFYRIICSPTPNH